METEATGLSIGGIFEAAGEVVTGFMTMATNFVTGLWENPMGKIVIGLGLAGGAIGLAYKLFLRKKHV